MLAAQRLEAASQRAITYPETDGKPMADNTVQYEWMVTLQGGIDTLVPDFVAGNLFWYPVEGHPEIVQAPDVLVAQGRPKGHRRSYKQWEEGGVAPQVVIEVLSPGNKLPEMIKKFLFYQRYGVQEYYILDPDNKAWMGYRRVGEELVEIPEMDGFVSPRLGIRFAYEGEEPVVLRPDGSRFRSFAELSADEAEQRARAEQERARAEEAQTRAEEAQTRAEQERARAEEAQTRAEEAQTRAEQERARAEALAERLRALGVEV